MSKQGCEVCCCAGKKASVKHSETLYIQKMWSPFLIIFSTIPLFFSQFSLIPVGFTHHGETWPPRGSAEMVAGHPALQQEICMLTMRAAEELLVRQHAGSVAGRTSPELVMECDSCLLLFSDFWFRMLGGFVEFRII